jgi:hypothetical protein
MANFPNADPALSCRYQDKKTHGGNHAPSVADWWKNDDTLDRQGVSPGKPNGHGICKGTASSWVIAFLNNVPEASDPKLYEKYYTDFLRYQATMIKDAGKHIDSHVAQFKKLGVDTNIVQVKQFQAASFKKSDMPSGRWGAYISVWSHDIAIGGTKGGGVVITGGKFYICEPNTGLLGYTSRTTMLSDLDAYMAARRASKQKPATEPAGFWVYRKG